MFDSIKKIKSVWWVYGGTLLFILLNAYFIYKEQFLFSVFPIVVLIGVAAFLSLDKLMLGIVFCVPISVPLSEVIKGLPIDMFLPTEPLLAGILLIFVIKLIHEKQFDKQIIKHPVSLAIYAYLAWILITSLASSMPSVSIKFFISKLWFIVAFYFLATQLFRKPENARKYVLLYTYALCIVVFYALFRHIKYGIFDEKIAHWSANPFYKDHTSYGALLAWYIPPVVAMFFNKNYSPKKRTMLFIIASILFVGLITSYSRAAWVSLIGAFGIYILIRLRIKFSIIFSGILIVTLIAVIFGNDILRTLESNRQESSTNLADHVRSIGNVSSDASNLERLNRWNCAISMFKEKPFFGWGPGTYMFNYAPFQLAKDKTIISTNNGDGGNAHSEYLGPLAEQGVFGTINYLLIIILTVTTGLRALKNCNNKELKVLGMAALIGLFTYYFHGFLNNFLDTDKASAPFWGFTALLVAIDVYYNKKQKQLVK